jgi:NTP pyrophosphatase (non-canonical NTP hydrolase)
MSELNIEPDHYLFDLAFAAHDNAKRKGFNGAQELVDKLLEYNRITKEEHSTLTTYVKLAKVALIQSELGEMVEAIRRGDYDNEQEEASDVIIRLADYDGGYGLDLHTGVEKKMRKNLERPHMHGGKKA